MEHLTLWATSPIADLQATHEAIAYLRHRAERCRQLALQQFDAESTDELTRLAGLFDQEAARIEAADETETSGDRQSTDGWQ